MTGKDAASDSLARAAELLRRDVTSTVGPAHRAEVDAQLAALRADDFGDSEADLVERLIERVQQTFHDLFVDTTWPACPRHPNHPLWYRDGAWWCARDRIAVASLGEVPRRHAAG